MTRHGLFLSKVRKVLPGGGICFLDRFNAFASGEKGDEETAPGKARPRDSSSSASHIGDRARRQISRREAG